MYTYGMHTTYGMHNGMYTYGFWQIFVTNFCDNFFVTYNLLTFASFRIGVPSILFET